MQYGRASSGRFVTANLKGDQLFINVSLYYRLGDSLSSNEIEFIKRRKAHIKKTFAQFIRVDENEIHEDDLPIVGIASSGGGYRAMVSTAGVLRKQVSDDGC